MPAPRRVLLTPLGAAGRVPGACQLGHEIVWLLDGTEVNGDGSLIGGCACAYRHEDGRSGKQASTPSLWRYVPARGLVQGRLTPFFPSMNRVAYALALRLLDAHLIDRGAGVDDTTKAARLAAIAAGRALVRLTELEAKLAPPEKG